MPVETRREWRIERKRSSWLRLRGKSSPVHLVVIAALCLTGLAGAMVGHASAGPAPAVSRMGFYPGYSNVAGYTALETFVGHQTPYVVQFADASSTSAFTGSVWGETTNAGAFQTLNGGLTFVESVPLTLGLGFGATTAQKATALQATASGANDAAYKVAANYLKAAGYPGAVIRLGWEFDGGWMPWSAVGNEALWTTAYRHVADVFRSISAGFRFDWNGTASSFQKETAAYPGDDYVDIIGLDVYDKGLGVAWDSTTKTWTNPADAWSTLLPKLTFHRDFAIAHGKQVSYPEWALDGLNATATSNVGGDNPTFIQGMFDWQNSLPASGPGSLAYQSYFNEDQKDGNHRINASWFPQASSLFQRLFGSTALTTTTTTAVPVTTTTAVPVTTTTAVPVTTTTAVPVTTTTAVPVTTTTAVPVTTTTTTVAKNPHARGQSKTHS
jgi:hypothetical protein